MLNNVGITVGVEQEMIGYTIHYDQDDLGKKKNPKCFAIVSIMQADQKKQPCVYITEIRSLSMRQQVKM